jgi:hypothetical protein
MPADISLTCRYWDWANEHRSKGELDPSERKRGLELLAESVSSGEIKSARDRITRRSRLSCTSC